MPGGKGNITGADGKLFTKGDARINKLGRPKKLNLDRLLRRVLAEKVNDQPALKQILTKLRDMAIDGDLRAAELLLDRAFGKAKQPTGPIRPTVITAIQYVLPDGNKDTTNREATPSVGIIEES